MIIAAIEAGGTKFVLGLLRTGGAGMDKPELLSRQSIPTTSPSETLRASGDFFEAEEQRHGRIEAIGIGSFGPVDLRNGSPSWGHVTTTPKPGWSGADVAGYFIRRFKVPVAFDTDVNAAAYGEYLWGEARGIRDFVYITVGTGIGGGVFSGGKLVHGLSHPELGHIMLAREPGDGYEGCCPYHKACLEGLAAGPAIGNRWGKPAPELPGDHPAWALEASYLARAISIYALVLSPELVLLGGGVGMRPGLAEKVSLLVGKELAGYVPALADETRLSGYVKRPALGSEAGLYGSAALALDFPSD
jgi:fructokinase